VALKRAASYRFRQKAPGGGHHRGAIDALARGRAAWGVAAGALWPAWPVGIGLERLLVAPPANAAMLGLMPAANTWPRFAGPEVDE